MGLFFTQTYFWNKEKDILKLYLPFTYLSKESIMSSTSFGFMSTSNSIIAIANVTGGAGLDFTTMPAKWEPKLHFYQLMDHEKERKAMTW